MSWYVYVMVVTLVVSPLLQIAFIGKPRTPITPGQCIASLVINGLFIWGILVLAGAL